MDINDSEPPHLFKSSVLRNGKTEYTASQYPDQHLIKSLEKIRTTQLIGVVQRIGVFPLIVDFYTTHQKHVYNH